MYYRMISVEIPLFAALALYLMIGAVLDFIKGAGELKRLREISRDIHIRRENLKLYGGFMEADELGYQLSVIAVLRHEANKIRGGI